VRFQFKTYERSKGQNPKTFMYSAQYSKSSYFSCSRLPTTKEQDLSLELLPAESWVAVSLRVMVAVIVASPAADAPADKQKSIRQVSTKSDLTIFLLMSTIRFAKQVILLASVHLLVDWFNVRRY